VLEETNDREEIIGRVAALDIGKAELVCCVRVPGSDRSGKRLQEVKTYSTMTRSLLVLVDRLRELGVTRVVMEATSDYWRSPFYLLEAQGFEVWLVNARDVKHLPGRPKTDRLDAVWLCKLAERQMLRPSFVPPPPIRRLRDLTRYRADLVATRTAEKQRVEKLLEDAQIKLSVVASDIFGVSGRDMLAALLAGERDPKALAQLARGRMRAKLGVLQEAFTGHFSDHHGFLLATMLGRIDQATADIAAVEAHIETEIAPFQAAVDRLDEITGVGRAAAHVIIAEIGVDMAASPPLRTWPPGPGSRPGSTSQPARQGQERHRARQPLPGPGARRGRGDRRADRHLPWGALPAHRAAPRQEEGDRRGGPVHPGHRLAAAGRPRRPLPRPGLGLLRHPRQRRPRQAQPHPPARGPRLQGHPPTRRLTDTAANPTSPR